ncbi:MAG: DNA-directed RNA polymerase subunit K [Thermoplasmata archaeon]
MTRKHTRFEKARIIGARSLQISMGAPPLIEVPGELLDPVEIAVEEYERSVIPISVIREE